MSLAISEEQLARRLVVNRRLAQTVDQAGAVMNRAAFATPDVLNMALDVLSVPNDDWRPTLWKIHYTDTALTIESCRAFIRAVKDCVQDELAGIEEWSL